MNFEENRLFDMIKNALMDNLDVKSDKVFLPIGSLALVYGYGPTKTLHIKNYLAAKYDFFLENAKGGIIIKRLHFYAWSTENKEEFNKWAEKLKAKYQKTAEAKKC